MPEWASLLLLLPAGFVAGVVNTLAGGGSFLTLPALIALGLSEQVANGSNRVAILLQTAWAAHLYDKHEAIDRKVLATLLVSMLPGALLGIYVASILDAETFKASMGILFLVFTMLMLLKRKQLLVPPKRPLSSPLVRVFVFFLVGAYGGFLQAGVGLVLLLTMSAFLGRQLSEANGLKLALVLFWTVPAVMWFAYVGQVRWLPGLVLGVGNVAGAHLGAKLGIKKGNPLIFAAVVIVMLLTAVRLLLG